MRFAEKFAPEGYQESFKEEFEDLQLMEDDVIAMETDGQPRRLDAILGDVLNQKVCLHGKSHGAPTQPATQQHGL